ncbi:phosphatase PAP2 family protein [Sphingomonas sp. Root241]|uniref:phosphatase PAP2 family protein n=1 Tax=Sphingomonas sp. Root241 TaxID=1736501 RepID=UPI0006F5BC8C|nr:phosphatase PAP2 family protein [Sphingomonas sp. Root241]KRC82348.1 hypothetical protein ASE13_08635 [Sphingomonas sp. Root241]
MIGQIVSRLRHGVPEIERRRAFDASPPLVYTVLAAVALATAAGLLLLRFTIDPDIFLYALWPAWLWLGGILVKRVGHTSIGGAAEVAGLVYAGAFAFIFGILCLTAIATSDQDAALHRADLALGFDWRAFADWIRPYNLTQSILTAVYRSLVWQSAAIIALLFAAGRGQRAWRLAAAWFASLLLCSAFYPFFPAQGPMVYFHFQEAQFPGLLSDSPWRFGPIIHAVRDQGLRHIEPVLLTGLITFPSFHVAAALILGWAAGPVRYVGPVFVVLNALMGVSAIICGPHYLVDIIAGIGAGLAGIVLSKYIVAFRIKAE